MALHITDVTFSVVLPAPTLGECFAVWYDFQLGHSEPELLGELNSDGRSWSYATEDDHKNIVGGFATMSLAAEAMLRAIP